MIKIFENFFHFNCSIFFSNKIEGCLSLGARPSISFCAQIYFVVAVIFLFEITYLSKSFNHSKNVCKMIKFRHSGFNRKEPCKVLKMEDMVCFLWRNFRLMKND